MYDGKHPPPHFFQKRAAHIDDIVATPWHETEEDVAEGLAWSAERERLIGIVLDYARAECSAEQYKCLYLHFVDGLSYQECAEFLHLNRSTVWRNCKRALKKITPPLLEAGHGYSEMFARLPSTDHEDNDEE